MIRSMAAMTIAVSLAIDGLHHDIVFAGTEPTEGAKPFTRIIGLAGEQAPGAPPGAIFHEVFGPSLNAEGRVAFHAVLEGEGISFANRAGIWSEASGHVALVARSGSQAPDPPEGVRFEGFLGPPLINGLGQSCFVASLAGAGVDETNNVGIWNERNGDLSLIARAGDRPMGMQASVVFGLMGNLMFNASGRVAFAAGLRGERVDSGNDEAIWSDGRGMLTMVAREGDPAPGMPAGMRFSQFGTGTGYFFTLNSRGKVAFFARVTARKGSDADDMGIWSESETGLQLVAGTGAHAPGTSAGVVFSNLGDPTFNGQGHTAFAAMLKGGRIDATNGSGIWSQGRGSLALVARAGDHAPGAQDDVRFGDFYIPSPSNLLHPVMNSAGQTAFRGTLVGNGVNADNATGIWAERDGSLSMVVRAGDHAPGAPDGAVFSGFDEPAFNSSGQVAFRAFVTGPGIDQFNDIGIWAEDRSRQLHLIALTGDMLEVAPGDIRRVGSIYFDGRSGNDDGRYSAFNDLGQVAFEAAGIGGVISSAVAIPEPAAAVLVLPIIACATRRIV